MNGDIANAIRALLRPETDFDAPLTPFEKACLGLSLLVPWLGLMAVAVLCGWQ